MSMTDKERARQQVRRAISSGALKRQPCEVCGNRKTEAHHDDYSRPLDVVWLCEGHHRSRHRGEYMSLLKPREVARIMNVKERTVTRWCREGTLKAVKVGRVWRINRLDLKKFMEPS